MIKKNKVSLWLGHFDSADDLKDYARASYDEQGNYIASVFQRTYQISEYDLDCIETDWISEPCTTAESLLGGFSWDYEIIPNFKKILMQRNLKEYNGIILLYDYEYTGTVFGDDKLEYIGCVDFTAA